MTRLFETRFRAKPRVFYAPGRVNLIGEHTDYSEGFVMPAAIQLGTWVAVAPRSDQQLVVHSESIAQSATINLQNPIQRRSEWTDYVAGVVDVLRRQGIAIGGADMLIVSTVPRGAGLSSSAALEVAAASALLALAAAPVDPLTVAKWCQQAENDFVGARCGIMDQYVTTLGRRDRALLIDCRTLESRPLPLPPDVRVVVCNTMVKHAIAAGEYNARRADCETAVATLATVAPTVRTLRDVTRSQVEQHGALLPPTILKRARHVVTENERVLAAAEALESENVRRFGELMRESHRSLREDFEVSCRELDAMVELATPEPGVYGARMTGGGFGGCTVNLVSAKCVDRFVGAIKIAYFRQMRTLPEVYVCAAADGVAEVTGMA